MQKITPDVMAKINSVLTEWRRETWSQLTFFQVGDDCIPRFTLDLLSPNRFVTTPEVSLSVLTAGSIYLGPAELLTRIKEKEIEFYTRLKVHGNVPKGQVSYRGTFWEHIPSQGVFAALSYANSYQYIASAERVANHL